MGVGFPPGEIRFNVVFSTIFVSMIAVHETWLSMKSSAGSLGERLGSMAWPVVVHTIQCPNVAAGSESKICLWDPSGCRASCTGSVIGDACFHRAEAAGRHGSEKEDGRGQCVYQGLKLA